MWWRRRLAWRNLRYRPGGLLWAVTSLCAAPVVPAASPEAATAAFLSGTAFAASSTLPLEVLASRCSLFASSSAAAPLAWAGGPGRPGAPGLPGRPGVPGAPAGPPSLEGCPGSPISPGAPIWPGSPSSPGPPGFPGCPSAPSFPGRPGSPGVPPDFSGRLRPPAGCCGSGPVAGGNAGSPGRPGRPVIPVCGAPLSPTSLLSRPTEDDPAPPDCPD